MIIYDVSDKNQYDVALKKSMGEEQIICPRCSHTRNKKTDKCLSWNHEKNVGHCNHCNAAFVKYEPNKYKPKKEYIIPKWENKTGLTDKALIWFESRGISQSTLNKMRIYSDKRGMNIRMSDGEKRFYSNAEVICFPFFVNDEESPRNIKYRGSNKSFSLESGAELVFYNLDLISGYKELIIVEGEIDALSYIEAGYDNTISVPNGAGSRDLTYLDNYIDSLDVIETFYIAVDFDQKGLELREELIRRLSPEKCKIVSFDGYKDANELLVAKGKVALRDTIENAKDTPIRGEVNLSTLYDSILYNFLNGIPKGVELGFPPIDNQINWDTGRLAIWTGTPGSGKSNVLDMVSVLLNVKHNWKTVYYSPEYHPVSLHISHLIEKLTGKRFSQKYMSTSEFEQAFEYVSDNFFTINPDEYTTIEDILSVAQQFVKRKGIKHLVIDPFNTLEHNTPQGMSQTTHIGKILDLLTRFARKNNILVSLVAHPRKINRRADGTGLEIPTMYDISGSSTFYDKADYGIVIFRDYINNLTRFIVQKVKFRQNGRITSDENDGLMQYNCDNGRYDVFNYRNTDSFLNIVRETESISFPSNISDWDDLPD